MDSSRTYIAPTVIAILQDKVRTTALRQMLAGHYGPIIRRGRRNTPYVPLAAVADFHGVTITTDQFDAAVDGHRDRFFTIPTPEPEAVEVA
jgi:hypothetical protein